jgi:hypothetical protein
VQVACGVFPPLNAIPSPMPASLAAALDNLEPELSSLFQEVGATAAAFTIVYDQSILRTYGFGSTRQPPSAGTNVTGDTVFRIGSVTKASRVAHTRDTVYWQCALRTGVPCSPVLPVRMMYVSCCSTQIFATMPMFQLRDAGKVSVETQVNSIRTDYTPKQHPSTPHRPCLPSLHCRLALATELVCVRVCRVLDGSRGVVCGHGVAHGGPASRHAV